MKNLTYVLLHQRARELHGVSEQHPVPSAQWGVPLTSLA